MGFKSKKYYYDEVLETYLKCKDILGASLVKKHTYKKKLDGIFDGYVKFNLKDESLGERYISLNNEFDNIWDKYNYLKLKNIFLNDEITIDKNTNIFYGIILLLTLGFNIYLMTVKYFNSAFLILFGLLMFFVPTIIYSIKIIMFINKKKIILKHENVFKEQELNLKQRMFDILNNSEFKNDIDLKALLNIKEGE